MVQMRRWGRWMLWAVMGIIAAGLILIAIVVIPIITHTDSGPSTPVLDGSVSESVAASTGSDGRDRTLSVFAEDGVTPADLSAVQPGDRFVVRGRGFDPAQGIYVAVCANPGDPATKPAPCLGGIPEGATEKKDASANRNEFIPSTWITDAPVWRPFATRGYDSETGEFTAYLQVPEATAEGLDCRVDTCAIVSRNDHTAAGDRVQDLLVDLEFGPTR
ncbi:hypothetical protein GCM10022198_16590 [Klugiella xanthotipulae]|uniref:Uncharacterized protein n=1 Tax=Klugiella xanthotipulae TaxID=244735 RepID=A0A543HH87_9MICO|nr:hypothetical protein [Klugiella xanthotipulae]TQM57695.1 hypothetical protein FB466_2691 [Klugiella xanthotipulae]